MNKKYCYEINRMENLSGLSKWVNFSSLLPGLVNGLRLDCNYNAKIEMLKLLIEGEDPHCYQETNILILDDALKEEELEIIKQANYDVKSITTDAYADLRNQHNQRRELFAKMDYTLMK